METIADPQSGVKGGQTPSEKKKCFNITEIKSFFPSVSKVVQRGHFGYLEDRLKSQCDLLFFFSLLLSFLLKDKALCRQYVHTWFPFVWHKKWP